ncbi:major facilitator superfamily domain-containing protein, partial [Syncephalis fuscata]
TPLPKRQLIVICLARVVEVISFTVHLPFIYFVQDVLDSSDSKQIAYHVSYLSSTFGIAQFISGVQWGHISDRVGRRPTFLFSMFIITISSLVLGLSRSFALMFAINLIAGLGKSNIGIIKSMIGEITDPTNQAHAFRLLPMIFAIGGATGSFVGGSLARPAKQFPDTLGRLKLLQDYPYLLPMGLTALLCAIGFVVCLFYLKETLPTRLTSRFTTEEEQGLLDSQQTVQQPILPKLYSFLPTIDRAGLYVIGPVILSYTAYTLLFSIFDSISLLWMSTATNLQGLGLDSSQIGWLLTATNVAAFLGQWFIYVPVHYRCGSLWLYRYALIFYIPFSLLLPLL